MSFDEEGSICVEATVSDEDTYPLGCSGGPYLAGVEVGRCSWKYEMGKGDEESGMKNNSVSSYLCV